MHLITTIWTCILFSHSSTLAQGSTRRRRCLCRCLTLNQAMTSKDCSRLYKITMRLYPKVPKIVVKDSKTMQGIKVGYKCQTFRFTNSRSTLRHLVNSKPKSVADVSLTVNQSLQISHRTWSTLTSKSQLRHECLALPQVVKHMQLNRCKSWAKPRVA